MTDPEVQYCTHFLLGRFWALLTSIQFRTMTQLKEVSDRVTFTCLLTINA
jgi:hypothetical protein